MGTIGQRQSSLLAAALAAYPSLTAAAELRIEVAGLRNADGLVFVAVCTEDEFLRPVCTHVGRAPASEGVVTVTGVPPGTYAVQAVHDENGNERLDRLGFLPIEGMGFSRDAPMRRGPPRWGEAAFDLPEPGAVVRLTMRYFQ
jgi:uncharacterized protein (DUF2141 family)